MHQTEILSMHDTFKNTTVRIIRQVQFDLPEGEFLEGVCLAVVQGSHRPLAICEVVHQGRRYVTDFDALALTVIPSKKPDTLLDSRDDDIGKLLDPRPLTDAQRQIMLGLTGVVTECRARPSDLEFADFDYLRRAGYLEIAKQEKSPNGFISYRLTAQGRAVHGG